MNEDDKKLDIIIKQNISYKRFIYVLEWFELLNLNLDYKNENIPALTWWEMDTKTKERKNAFLKYWSWAAIL